MMRIWNLYGIDYLPPRLPLVPPRIPKLAAGSNPREELPEVTAAQVASGTEAETT